MEKYDIYDLLRLGFKFVMSSEREEPQTSQNILCQYLPYCVWYYIFLPYSIIYKNTDREATEIQGRSE